MKRPFGYYVMIAVAVLSVSATSASAMLNPRLGRFMQRDPLGTAIAPPVSDSAVQARNISDPQFTQRDPVPGEQYEDGMNLYQLAVIRSTTRTQAD